MLPKEKHVSKDTFINMKEKSEVIDGELVILDSGASIGHVRALNVIRKALEGYIAKNNGSCEVFTESARLFCNDIDRSLNENYYLPDIMVVCDSNNIDDEGVHSAPLMVIEITSPSTRQFDYGQKMVVYEKIGVKEYWIVDLQKKVVTVYKQLNNFIAETHIHCDKLAVSVYPGLEIDLSSIWE
ncbi:MAG: Uma2 family endonuclease [Pseudobutyrivibrio ruminis]|nr:Uma2 family endonuclease [Pseudobutyrivibrio ruminis]